jgi:hypothetical protein
VEILAHHRPSPNRTRFATNRHIGKTIVIQLLLGQCGAVYREGILREQMLHSRRTSSSRIINRENHGELWLRAQRRKPHLPIQPWLVWRNPSQRARNVARLEFELIGLPFETVVAALNDDLRS